MTREERKKAIDALKISTPIMAMTQEEFNDYIQTLNEVMDWLEQEPCEDCISRQAVIEQTYNWSKDEFLRVTNPFDYLRKRINSLPSVKPQEPILEKIRAEIDIARFIDKDTKLCKNANASGLEVALQIIDKYRGEVDCRDCKAEYECYYCKKYEESEETE